MKFRNKGRKIYKTKEKNYYGKTPFGKFMSAALTVLLIGGIGFLGYSAAEPLVNFTKKRGDEALSLPETVTSDNEPTVDSTSIEIKVPQNNNAEIYKAAVLKPQNLKDISSLKAALSNINVNVGYQYVMVPLKISGGEIYYASSVREAQMSGAVQSALTLAEITAEIKNAGYMPAAEISLLNDYTVTKTYADMSYTTIDDGSRWIDSKGKYWLSPFSASAVSYIGAIADEIAAADFEKVICSDVVFPQFKESDLVLLGDKVSGSENYLALTSLTNSLYNKLMSGGATMLLEVSAIDILKENTHVIQPMLLDVNTLVLDIDFDEIGDAVAVSDTVYEFTGTAAEKASKLIGLVQYKLADYNVAVRFSGDGIQETELIKAKDVIAGYGYNSFMIG